jgi:hypothetical protein
MCEKGVWFVDLEGVIKRKIYDDDGNPNGYELLVGDYREIAAAIRELAEMKAKFSKVREFLN